MQVRSGPATVTRVVGHTQANKTGESGRLPQLAVVASRVRRPDPDMPRAWIPAGRV